MPSFIDLVCGQGKPLPSMLHPTGFFFEAWINWTAPSEISYPSFTAMLVIEPKTELPPRSIDIPPLRGFSIAFAFIFGLSLFALIGQVRGNSRLFWSFIGIVCVLLGWSAVLFGLARQRGRRLLLEFVPRPQHYLQACLQTAIYAYWGWYWRQVYESYYLVIAQLVFAYAFDLLLSWSRRDTYRLGFLPFPIVFSTNLFLWFKPDWFYFQFMMLAVGFTAKELLRWNKQGRDTHIFNPSSFSLMVFSLGLLLTGTTDITWGKEIAITQFYPPHMYVFIFLIGLPAQFLFGVTTMTMPAAVTTYLFGLAYYHITGVYFFFDSYIPISVFFGMHLLFTDPSTAPRTELGRIIFGALYGLGNVVLYYGLHSAGAPEFYDKLLPVPILNMMIQLIDRAAGSKLLHAFDPAGVARSLAGRRRNLAYIALWAIVFAMASAAQGIGDKHPGQFVPFWQQACREDRPHACAYLMVLHTNFCRQGSGWACNELGILEAERERDRTAAVASFERACDLGFTPACRNMERTNTGNAAPETAPPTVQDYPIVLRGSKAPIATLTPSALYTMACNQGWPETCERKLQSE